MDPYLERAGLWGGFHSNLYNRIQTALNRQLPEGYFADVEEYVWLETDTSDERRLLGKPDVFVSDTNGAPARTSSGGGIASLAQPVRVTLPGSPKAKAPAGQNRRARSRTGGDRDRSVKSLE